MWNFFDRVYCINLDKRRDRWADVSKECARVGIQLTRINAHDGDNKHLAFNQSQYKALTQGLADRCKRFLILEDDVAFKNLDHLPAALSELPDYFDMVFLGANVREEKPAYYSPHLRVLRDSWTTHAVGYTARSAMNILATFKPEEFPIYDEWLRVNIEPKGHSYIVAPQVALQKPSFSDIWQVDADYTSLFEDGNKKLAI